MSLLNPTRLRSEVDAREARKIKVFEHILDLCYNKIMSTNRQCGDCCCLYACPSVVFGMPLFNLMDCIRFIMMKLVEKGFEVHLAIPNNIFISWKKDSNPDYSRQMYMLEAPIKNVSPPSSTYNKNYNTPSNYKLFSSKPIAKKEKEKNYRPINDYGQTNIDSSSGRYASSIDDIDLFHCKLDELLA